MSIPRSAAALGATTGTPSDELLFALVRSGWPPEMTAEFVSVPPPVTSGVRTTAIGTLADTGTSPRLHVSVPAARAQLPCPGVAEPNCTPAGSVSTTVVAVEGLAPL